MPRYSATQGNVNRKGLRKRKGDVGDESGSDSDFENNDTNQKPRKKIPKEIKSKYFKDKCPETSLASIRKPFQARSYQGFHFSNKNIIHYLYDDKKYLINDRYRESLHSIIVKDISDFAVFRATSPFDRRVTSLTWHPTLSYTLAVGSKGGDLYLWDTKDERNEFISGPGPDGTIKAMKFHPQNHTKVYTASVCGTVGIQDFMGHDSKIFLRMDSCTDYYSALDVSNFNKIVAAGDTKGNIVCLDLEGKIISETRLHKQKLTHIEFSPRESWILTTASLDHTVKLWDIRNLKNTCLESLQHDKAVNSAYFSLKDGVRLLTTDQHSQLRVYRGPLWTLENVIPHPHRQFQHLTPIKAHWYPLDDIIVVGRYPDPSFKAINGDDIRSIDFIDPENGKLLYQLTQIGVTGIISLNAFNRLGDYLASGMGLNILIWRNKASEEIRERLRKRCDTVPLQDKKRKRSERVKKKKGE